VFIINHYLASRSNVHVQIEVQRTRFRSPVPHKARTAGRVDRFLESGSVHDKGMEDLLF
jgi:hypothetical protein